MLLISLLLRKRGNDADATYCMHDGEYYELVPVDKKKEETLKQITEERKLKHDRQNNPSL